MLDRRELLTALLGGTAAAIAGCSSPKLPTRGELLSPNFALGHQLRDGRAWPTSRQTKQVEVLIVGGGVAGLSAAWQLQRSARDDFAVLELDNAVGGTARSGQQGKFSFPWGAHYVPTPMADHGELIQLFDEMQLLDGMGVDGTPQVKEQHLCRDPEERVFFQGRWYEGLYPGAGATPSELQELEAFRVEIDRWVERRDQQGRRMFAIPMSHRSVDQEVMSLDQLSMSQWMQAQGWDSDRLRWLVDYCCRDDYGLSIDQTSAWAGLFYFASRQPGANQESQAVITWPEGNGRIVNHMASRCGDRLRLGQAVLQIRQDHDDVQVDVLDVKSQSVTSYRCQQLIFAAPQFLVPYLIKGLEPQRLATAKMFRYGSWMVANVHVENRPAENGFPMSWDNVIHGSKSLGYVTSTHQEGIDHGPTVLTWYYPMVDADPRISRQQMLSLDWAHWADVVMSDLAVPHPDIHDLVTQLDVMRWGHAMVQPTVGFVSGTHLRQAAQPIGRVHFAGTDLSGIALMEEAFHHGLRAAHEVIQAIG